jgi:hypothetical protein
MIVDAQRGAPAVADRLGEALPARDGARARWPREGVAAPVRFFVAGVAKAGTTALCEFLGQHPQVFMCPIKEPTFFAARELMAFDADSNAWVETRALDVRRWLAGKTEHPPRHGLALEWAHYDALFRGVREQRAIGEGSVNYWWAPGAPAAIRETFPDARFVVMLRNPADRLFSEYLAMRWAHPLRTFAEHIALKLGQRDGSGVVMDAGYYATHLERFFTHFPRERFSIHLYEDFSANPRSVCRDILAFLGVDPDHPIDVSQRINSPQLPRWPRLHAVLPVGFTRALWRWIPRRWRDRARGVYSGPRSQQIMSAADRSVLAEHYREEIQKTAQLIDRDLSPWLCSAGHQPPDQRSRSGS